MEENKTPTIEETQEQPKKKFQLPKLIKFSLVSWSGALIKFLLFALFNEVCKWDYWLSYFTSLIISLIYGYIMNKKLTFRLHGKYGKTLSLTVAFYIVFIPLSSWSMEPLANLFTDKIGMTNLGEYMALLLISIANYYLEFFYDKHIVFKKKKKTGTI